MKGLRIGNINLLRNVVMVILSALMEIFCLWSATNEIILHNSTPLNLNTATVNEIESNKLVDATITDTVGAFMYEKNSKKYYYLIPMENGMFIIFATSDVNQKNMLDTYIDSYDGKLNLEINGRISLLTTEEKNVFFNSVVDADIGVNSVEKAQQYIVSYKIENDSPSIKWVWIIIGIILLAFSIITLLNLIKKRQNNKNYINAMPDNGYDSNRNAYNPYSNDEYYTGYDNPQQNDINPQNTQANNNQNDIHRF